MPKNNPYMRHDGTITKTVCPNRRDGIHFSAKFKCASCLHHHCQECPDCPVCACTSAARTRRLVVYT